MSQGDPQYITYSTFEEEFRIHTEGCGCCANYLVEEDGPLRASVADLVIATQEKLALLLKVLTY